MNFKPDLAMKVMRGEKTVTRRMPSDNPRSPWYSGDCALHVGRDYAVCPGRGKKAIGRIRIIDVRLEELGRIMEDGEAQREGFGHPREFADVWTAMHNGICFGDLVWRVQFEVVR